MPQPSREVYLSLNLSPRPPTFPSESPSLNAPRNPPLAIAPSKNFRPPMFLGQGLLFASPRPALSRRTCLWGPTRALPPSLPPPPPSPPHCLAPHENVCVAVESAVPRPAPSPHPPHSFVYRAAPCADTLFPSGPGEDREAIVISSPTSPTSTLLPFHAPPHACGSRLHAKLWEGGGGWGGRK